MSGKPVSLFVQTLPVYGSALSDLDAPIPVNVFIVEPDGSVRRGDGISLYQQLPVLCNVSTIVSMVGDVDDAKSAIADFLQCFTIDTSTNVVNYTNRPTVGGTQVRLTTDAITIANDTVTNAQLKTTNSGVIKGRLSTGSGVVEDIPLSQLRLALTVPTLPSAAAGDVGKALLLTNSDGTYALTNTLTGFTFKNEKLTYKAQGTLSGGTTTINYSDGSWHTMTISSGASVTLNLNFDANSATTMLLEIIGGGSGTVSFNPVVNFVTSNGTFQTTPNDALQASGGRDFIAVWQANGVRYGKVMR